jgi:hypothetical protein
LADEKGIDFYYKNRERAFAQKFGHIKPNLEEFIEIEETKVGGGKKVFKFSPKVSEVA